MPGFDFKYMFMTHEGRINRQLWWMGIGVLFAIGIGSLMLFGADGLVNIVVQISLGVAGVMLNIKRCHDRNKSGWWCLLQFIPLVGLIWMIVDLGILEGSKGENRFGADPLQA